MKTDFTSEANSKLFGSLHKKLTEQKTNIDTLLAGIGKIDTSEMPVDKAKAIAKMHSEIPKLVSEMNSSGDPMAVYKKIESEWLSGLQK